MVKCEYSASQKSNRSNTSTTVPQLHLTSIVTGAVLAANGAPKVVIHHCQQFRLLVIQSCCVSPR
jgi:hypothetical protein